MFVVEVSADVWVGRVDGIAQPQASGGHCQFPLCGRQATGQFPFLIAPVPSVLQEKPSEVPSMWLCPVLGC